MINVCCRELQSKLQSDAAVEWKLQKRQQNRSVYVHKLIVSPVDSACNVTSQRLSVCVVNLSLAVRNIPAVLFL